MANDDLSRIFTLCIVYYFPAERPLSAARRGTKNRLSINLEQWIENQKLELLAGPLNKIVNQ